MSVRNIAKKGKKPQLAWYINNKFQEYLGVNDSPESWVQDEIMKATIAMNLSRVDKLRREQRLLIRSLPATQENCHIDNISIEDITISNFPFGLPDVIMTDPPYGQEYLPVYETLAIKSAELLSQGGSLVVMVGQSYLLDIFTSIAKYLKYQWTLAYLTPGGQSAQLWAKKVNTFWKPILWFVKGEYTGHWIGDVSKSAVNDNDKRFHQWGQSESGMADLVRRLSKRGNIICDPFMGAGTTGKVALNLGRRFVGFDRDIDAFEKTKERLQWT